MKLTARREMRYAGRRLKAGDEFEASRQDARVLLALHRASEALPPAPAPVAVKRQPETAPAANDEPEADKEPTKAELAAEFEAATGERPNSRWNKAELEQELAQARAGRYQRRDMRAEE